MRVAEMNREQLEAFQAECQKQYAAFQAANLKLDMSRGKPSPKQLDLTNGITTCLTEEDYRAENGLDCRNYGCLDGLPEAKAFFAPMLKYAKLSAENGFSPGDKNSRKGGTGLSPSAK